MSGGGGGGLYSALSNSETRVCSPAIAAGWKLIEVAWNEPPINNTAGVFSGTQGPLALMVRSATLFQAIYESTFHTIGRPFVLCGQSGGSSQIAYALSHYGVSSFVDLAILTSGPPHTRLDYGMLGSAHPYWGPIGNSFRSNGAGHIEFFGGSDLFMDWSFGAGPAPGGVGFTACRDKSLQGGSNNFAIRDSILNLTAQTIFPDTDLLSVCGDGDSSEAPAFGRYYFSKISGKSKVDYITTGNVVHVDLVGSVSGSGHILDALAAARYNH